MPNRRTASGDANGARTIPGRNPFVGNRSSRLKGSDHPMAKLSDAMRSLLFQRWYSGAYSKAQLGRDFGISGTQVGRLIKVKEWEETLAKDQVR